VSPAWAEADSALSARRESCALGNFGEEKINGTKAIKVIRTTPAQRQPPGTAIDTARKIQLTHHLARAQRQKTDLILNLPIATFW
jgi:hypothetical protein